MNDFLRAARWILTVCSVGSSAVACGGASETAAEGGSAGAPSESSNGGGGAAASGGSANQGGAPTASNGGGSSEGGGGGAAAIVFTPGVFSLQAADHPTDPGDYESPDVAGAALRVSWTTLEPSDGEFDWSFLDDEAATAASAGKKVSVYFINDLPQWVVDAGAQTLSYIDHNPNHDGATLTMPIPWDPVFVSKWTAFVAAAGARYADDPTIAYVRGASEAMTHGWGMPNTDIDGNDWTTYGYTPEKLENAIEASLDAFMTAFPSTAEWVEVGVVPFEPDLTGNATTYVGQLVSEYGFQAYPERMGVWREDLSGCVKDPPEAVWILLAQHPSRDGAQMVWNVQDGPDRMNHCGITPNDKPTVMRAAIQRGLDLGMPYLEIYAIDVMDDSLADAMHFAHVELGS